MLFQLKPHTLSHVTAQQKAHGEVDLLSSLPGASAPERERQQELFWTLSPRGRCQAWPGKEAGWFPSQRVVPSSLGEGSVSAVYSSGLYSESIFQLGNMKLFFYLNAFNLLIIIFISLLSYSGFKSFSWPLMVVLPSRKQQGVQVSYQLDENFLIGSRPRCWTGYNRWMGRELVIVWFLSFFFFNLF